MESMPAGCGALLFLLLRPFACSSIVLAEPRNISEQRASMIGHRGLRDHSHGRKTHRSVRCQEAWDVGLLLLVPVRGLGGHFVAPLSLS